MSYIGLDLSTSTGYAVLSEDGKLLSSGITTVDNAAMDDYDFLDTARKMSAQISELIDKFEVTEIFIEQTNPNGFSSQKLLEFIHFAVLFELEKKGLRKKVHYIHTSRWRSVLQIRLSKDQKKHNAKASKRRSDAKASNEKISVKRGEGKITTKHLSVAWANQYFGLTLKLKDNDIADALALAVCGMSLLKQDASKQSLDQIIKKW